MPGFFRTNLLLIICNTEFLKNAGKDLTISKIQETKKSCYDIHIELKGMQPNQICPYLLYYTNYKSTLQRRTAFSYKTPAQERVVGNATWIPRPSEKRLDTSEAPNTGGQGVEQKRDGRKKWTLNTTSQISYKKLLYLTLL